jgi:hypothetical protein
MRNHMKTKQIPVLSRAKRSRLSMLCDVQEPTTYRRIYREHLLVGHGVKSEKTSKEDSCWRDEALNLASNMADACLEMYEMLQ